MIVGSPTKLNLIPSGVMPVVYINQGDAGYDKEFLIYNGDSPYNVPAGVSATIRGTKADGYGVTEAATVTTGSNLVTVTITEQMVAAAGENLYELVFVDTDDLRVASINMVWAVKADALGDAVISDSDLDYATQVMDQLQSVQAFKNQLDTNTEGLAAEIAARIAADNAESAARIAADNTLQSNINTEAATRSTTDASLQTQINQIVAPSGSAPSAAEVENARIGADGITYTTLGEAIRTNDNELREALKPNEALLEQGNISSSNGTTSASTSQVRTTQYLNVDTTYINKPANVGMTIYFYANPTELDNGYLGYGSWLRAAAIHKNVNYANTDYPSATHVKVRFDISGVSPLTVQDLLNTGLTIDYFIASDDLKKSISELNGRTVAIESVLGKNEEDVLEQGSFSSSSGKTSASTSHVRTTEYFSVDTLWVNKPAGVGMSIYFYANPTATNNGYLGYGTWLRAAAIHKNVNYANTDYPTATHVKVRFDISGVSPLTVDDILDAGVRLEGIGLISRDDILAASKSNNILFDKKWIACGDSFTHGDFTGLTDETQYIFQDAPYQGEYMVYPFFIGRRTGANVINEAVNGSTMAYISGRSNCFSEANGRYTQIPTDADYITLYFGINDSHQNVPIGTIDDNTNTTFYGAWNVVMTYLIQNYPNAKIGIIISNGCETIDYPNAEIAIAKKYGVAYFDMNGDPKIPLVFRTNGKPEISSTVKNLRNAQYYVGSGNAHPNAACHKDESTFIQAWLESI